MQTCHTMIKKRCKRKPQNAYGEENDERNTMLLLAKHIVEGAKEQGEEVSPKARQVAGSRASVVGIVLNIILCSVKALIGLLSGSISIVADAVNNLSDAASNIISLFGFKLAAKPADAAHPYGHGRYEYLAGLSVAVLVLVVGVELARGSIQKLFAPTPVEYSVALVVVLVLSIAVKLWMALFNAQVGASIDSGVLQAASVDSRNDAITTGAVLVAALLSQAIGFDLDGYMGLAVAVFILWSGIGLIRDAIDPLLGKPASPEIVQLIQNKMLSYQGILGIHDLVVHDYGPGRLFASIHAEVDAAVDILESHELIDAIEQDFLKTEGFEVVIHLDPIVTNDPQCNKLRAWIAQDVANIDPRLSIHDLRIVPGENRTNVIFDCYEPYTVELGEDVLKETISQHVAQQFPGYFCVIKIDRG